MFSQFNPVELYQVNGKIGLIYFGGPHHARNRCTPSGGPEVLEYTTVPKPVVKPGWSRIKVAGFGINHSEIFTRQGDSPSVKFPRILGIEVTGIIDVSTDTKLHPGQRVVSLMGEMGRDFDGSYAEYVLVPNHQIYPVTTTLTPAQLAAVPETYYTAFGIFNSLQLRLMIGS